MVLCDRVKMHEGHTYHTTKIPLTAKTRDFQEHSFSIHWVEQQGGNSQESFPRLVVAVVLELLLQISRFASMKSWQWLEKIKANIRSARLQPAYLCKKAGKYFLTLGVSWRFSGSRRSPEQRISSWLRLTVRYIKTTRTNFIVIPFSVYGEISWRW